MTEAEERADFYACLRRARVRVPPEREAVMFEAFQDFQALMRCLDEPLPYADEPAVAPHYLPGAAR
jgi:hypothetical protein